MIDIRYLNTQEGPGDLWTSTVNCVVHPEARVLYNYLHSGLRRRGCSMLWDFGSNGCVIIKHIIHSPTLFFTPENDCLGKVGVTSDSYLRVQIWAHRPAILTDCPGKYRDSK